MEGNSPAMRAKSLLRQRPKPPMGPRSVPEAFDTEAFRANAHSVVDYIADQYHKLQTAETPSRPCVQPGFMKLGPLPSTPIPFSDVLSEFDSKVMPGVHQWQHPHFFAYYPAIAAFPAMLGEFLASSFFSPNFSWLCNPADSEMEPQVMDWVAEALGLPDDFFWKSGKGGGGLLQPSATEAFTVVARAAVARAQRRAIRAQQSRNENGSGGSAGASLTAAGSDAMSFEDNSVVLPITQCTAYVGSHAHFATEKALCTVGVTRVRHVAAVWDETMGNYTMDIEALRSSIAADVEAGLTPVMIGVNAGTTGTCAIDDVRAARVVADEYDAWLSVDAAYAGICGLVGELRGTIAGWELGDSCVVNFSKSGGTLIGSSCLMLRDREVAKAALSHTAVFLQTGGTSADVGKDKQSMVADGDDDRLPYTPPDLKDYNLGLGRGWRSLKFWSFIKCGGLANVGQLLVDHTRRAAALGDRLVAMPRPEGIRVPSLTGEDAVKLPAYSRGPLFELPTKPIVGLVTLRLAGEPREVQKALIEVINNPVTRDSCGEVVSGAEESPTTTRYETFLVEGEIDGVPYVRVALGQAATSDEDVAWLGDILEWAARVVLDAGKD